MLYVSQGQFSTLDWCFSVIKTLQKTEHLTMIKKVLEIDVGNSEEICDVGIEYIPYIMLTW
jgi:hypothetical protein